MSELKETQADDEAQQGRERDGPGEGMHVAAVSVCGDELLAVKVRYIGGPLL